MDDCKGVRHEFDSQDTAQCVAHDFGCALLGLLGWASPTLVLLAFVVVAFGVHSPKAYALSAKSSPEMVIDGNMVGDDAGSKGYLCVNCSPYTATLELIGHYSDIIQITDEQYSWLMGGNNPFAALADKWQELKGGESDEPTNTWLGDDGFIDGWLILAGKGNCWYGTFTDNQIRMAEIAFNSIMRGGTGEEGGGDSGGGESSGGGGGSGLPDNVPLYYTGNGTDYHGSVVAAEYDSAFETAFDDWVGTANWYVGTEANSTNLTQVALYRIGEKDSTADVTFEYENGVLKRIRNNSDTQIRIYRRYIYPLSFDASSKVLTMKGLQKVSNPIANSSLVVAGGFDTLTSLVYCSKLNGGGGGSVPDPPDVPKPPDDPEPPSPTPPTPDPPKPKDPTPRDPTPKPDPPRVYPKIDLPDVHITTEPTNTEPTDYTPWLRAIYNELKAFHEDFGIYFQDLLDELENHCQHIRDEISTQASYLGDCIEDVATEVSQQGNNLSNTIWEYADWLSKYMDAFGEWLVEHLSWNNEVNVDPYDDTSLMYWLRRIYTKLGGSNNPINTRPTDPVMNPKDTGNWLNELWETILKELAQVFPNLMIDLGLIFDDLKSKFPFSIPWDIHALLLLLVTEPVAPHFTIPMYALSTSYELEVVGEYDIDLSFYSDYLMGVHLMLEIAWIGYMLKHTKDYMELIEAVIPS